MNLLECIRVALDGILANKLRSFLTMLGIIIGVASVIAVAAIGQGGRSALQSEMERFGSNRFVIYYNYSHDKPITWMDNFTESDIKVISELAPAVSLIVPMSYNRASASAGGRVVDAYIRGTTSSFTKIEKLTLKSGRFFTEDDDLGRRQVGVINEALADELFPNSNPLGERIILNNLPVIVIGVLRDEPSAFGFDDSRAMIYLPIRSYFSIFNNNWIDNLHGKAVSQDRVQEAIDQSISILERRHRTQGKYRAYNMEKEIEMANRITGIAALIVGSIAAISLVVGGIGVMNIMLVSVTERTREIGIRKALGARRKDILVQFLIEAVVISLIGGMIGMIIGLGGALAVSMMANWPPLISWKMVVLAFLFSAGVGIFFGIYPANKAARLDPIDALRYE